MDRVLTLPDCGNLNLYPIERYLYISALPNLGNPIDNRVSAKFTSCAKHNGLLRLRRKVNLADTRV